MCFLSLAQTNISLALYSKAREIHQRQERREEKHEKSENTTREDLLSDLAFLI